MAHFRDRASALAMRIGCLLFAALLQARISAAQFVAPPTSAVDGSSRAGYLLRIPVPIRSQDLERYRQILVLSDQQFVYMQAMHQGYSQRFEAARARKLPVVIERSQCRAMDYTPERTRCQAAFYAAENGLLEELEEIDASFFNGLSSMLAEPQLPKLQRAQDHRRRSTCFYLDKAIREAWIDLSAIIETTPLPSNAVQQLDPLLAEYEQKLTPPFVAVDEHLRNTRTEHAWLVINQRFDDAGQPLEAGTPATKARIHECAMKRRELLKPRLELQKDIVAVNREYLARLLAMLPAEQAKLLQARYRDAAFPKIYPDYDDPLPLYDAILASPQVSEEVKLAIQEAWTDYRCTYERICADWCKLYERVMEEGARYHGTVNPGETRTEMRSFRSQRWSANRRIAVRMRDLLPAETPKLLELAADYLAELQRAEEDGARDGYPGW